MSTSEIEVSPPTDALVIVSADAIDPTPGPNYHLRAGIAAAVVLVDTGTGIASALTSHYVWCVLSVLGMVSAGLLLAYYLRQAEQPLVGEYTDTEAGA